MIQLNEWLSIDNVSGTGDSTITVTASSNSEIEERLASLVFKTASRSETVFIQQRENADKKYFWVEFEDEGGIITFKNRQVLLPYKIDISYSFDGVNWYNMSPYNETELSMGGNKKIYIYNNTRRLGTNWEYYSNYLKRADWVGKRMLFSSYCRIGGNLSALSEMTEWGFHRLFSYNEYLLDASELIIPWDTLSEGCFTSMFTNCKNLSEAPKLPSSILAESCYYDMFSECEALTTAPTLGAKTLVYGCYSLMFAGCFNINYISMLAEDYIIKEEDLNNEDIVKSIDAYCLLEWVGKYSLDDIGNQTGTVEGGIGVAENGTFVKFSDTDIPLGENGIPNGWVIINNYPSPENDNVIMYKTVDNNPYNPTITVADANITKTLYDESNGYFYMCFDAPVTTIKRNAFSTSDIIELILPNTVTTLENNIFDYSNITEFVIPDSVTSIDSLTLDNTNRTLKKLTIGGGITKFGDYLGSEGKYLDEIIIREGVEEIDWKYSPDNLTKLTLPSSLKVIGEGCFDFCENLDITNVLKDTNITTIGDKAFRGTKVNGSLVLPSTLTTIGSEAFNGLDGLTEVRILQSVETIGSSAFANNSSLSKIYAYPRVAPSYSSNMFKYAADSGTIYCSSADEYGEWLLNLNDATYKRWVIQEFGTL